MATLIEAFVPLHGDAERELLADLSRPTLRNWRGVEVGKLVADASLRRLSAYANRAGV